MPRPHSMLLALPIAIGHAWADEPKSLERVVVTADRPTSLPIEIPTTTEGVTAAEIEARINATDAEDALKYLPSLLVRRRYIGDYDHAVLATRASGTGNSARSLVYADGVLLSNLLGNGASFTPRWGLVTPEEIERVDVLYGPFSAAYPGNSAGAIVDYVTRLPKRFEAHAKLQAFTQHYALYGTDERYSGHQASASLGSRSGALTWWVNLNRLDSDAQPISFANRLVSAGVPGNAGTPVTGAVEQSNPREQPWVLFGATSQTHTVQEHAKVKLAYDLTPTLRASALLALWRNDAERLSQTFLADAAGAPVWSGVVNVSGRSYTLGASDFAPSLANLMHTAQGLSVKSHGDVSFNWSASINGYSYREDAVRSPTVVMPGALDGGAGRITDLGGTGWTSLAWKASWRPEGDVHLFEGGVQRDTFHLRQRVDATPSWRDGDAVASVTTFSGSTRLTSAWAQDTIRPAPDWRLVLGARLERWRAFDGAIGAARLGERQEDHLSPKAALAWQASGEWTLKASFGRAVRMPTVSELYQGSVANNVVVNNDPNLRPERSWTSELSAERSLESQRWRGTIFLERTADALYSQTNVTVTPAVTNIQNVDAIRTRGFETAWHANDLAISGFDVDASLTYADSIIVRNDKFPASVGRWQPRVPRWRASLLASYAAGERWSTSLGLRYSGRQYGQLDNSDTNGDAYTGFGRFLVVDARAQIRVGQQWRASLGVDNLTNRTYWAFHPYPLRTLHAELRYDL